MAGVLAGFLILSYYSVIAGWALAYVFRGMSGTFSGATAEGISSIFRQLTGDPERLLAWHTLFMVMTMIVVARGVSSGLESAVRYLMPALFMLLIMLVTVMRWTVAPSIRVEFPVSRRTSARSRQMAF